MPLLVILISGMVLIVLAADYFTNGIEWLGFQAHVHEGATGSLLAAMGTALPETLVPVAAIYFSGSKPDDAIGLGAIFGAPLMLATLGFAVIGVGLWSSGRRRLSVPSGPSSFRADLQFFLLAFAVAVAFNWIPRPWHPLGAALLVVLYGWHARRVIRAVPSTGLEAKAPDRPLHLFPSRAPSLATAGLQVAIALFGLVLGAHFFVQGLDQVTAHIRVSQFLLSVLITPVATELPEVFNSVIWLRHGRDSLAVGNVSGAMAFQASVVPALGLMVTRWQLSLPELATAAVAWLGAVWILWVSRQGSVRREYLLASVLIYFGFLGACLALLGVV